MLKKLISIFTVLCILILPNTSVYASEFKESNLEQFAEELDIEVEELLNLEENITLALDQLEKLTLSRSFTDNQKLSVQVSENLILETNSYVEESIARSSTRRTVTATMNLKNIYGGTVVTLTSVGVFTTNNSTVSVQDAYGSSRGKVWKINIPKGTTGGSSTSRWARNTFSGQLDIGVSPVSMTIQTFNWNNTITMNQRGSFNSVWR